MSLPKYDPEKDKNLISFFEKPNIQRLVAKSKASRLSSSKTLVTEESQNKKRVNK